MGWGQQSGDLQALAVQVLPKHPAGNENGGKCLPEPMPPHLLSALKPDPLDFGWILLCPMLVSENRPQGSMLHWPRVEMTM